VQTVSVSSTDGVTLALHHLTDCEPGSLPVILLSHATGFHGRCWLPVARHLDGRFDVWAHDHRGYGDSKIDADWNVRWDAFGDDSLAVAEYLTSTARPARVFAAGHSMGGATLIMAAIRRPELFAGIIAFEPIVFPQSGFRPDNFPTNPLVAATRKRRATFASLDEAKANFASKPPMSAFHPDALNAYVDYGFEPCADGVTLKCLPEHEARTYETGATSGMFARLHEVSVPVWVMAGAPAPFQPSSFAGTVAENIPRSTYVQWDEMGHFGPLEQPETIAAFVERTLGSVA